jgi:hypothetical protein
VTAGQETQVMIYTKLDRDGFGYTEIGGIRKNACKNN